ncbi:MAG: glycogen-binding domain-containing protein [Saprospiraceae bacterium]|nr:glycogen-binding domain-containing protein [Saprospiraceae bacterium]
MLKENGKWNFPVKLKPGKYLYKFVVDGNWIPDPENKFWEENEHGTNNSVLWINE